MSLTPALVAQVFKLHLENNDGNYDQEVTTDMLHEFGVQELFPSL